MKQKRQHNKPLGENEEKSPKRSGQGGVTTKIQFRKKVMPGTGPHNRISDTTRGVPRGKEGEEPRHTYCCWKRGGELGVGTRKGPDVLRLSQRVTKAQKKGWGAFG